MKMKEYNSVLICLLLVMVSCNGQQYPPTNMIAMYVADGSIRVTWDPPATGAGPIERYYVNVDETGNYEYVLPNNRVYLYNNTDPDTAYTISVATIITCRSRGSSQTTITTPKAIYRQKGTDTRFGIPKPPGGLSNVVFNGQIIFRLFGDNIINGGSTTSNGVSFSVTSSNTVLTISYLETKHAGYYYIMRQSGGTILGGELLVVTDNPTRPTITASSSSSVVDSSVTLLCSSSSQSKPDNHGLTLTSSWKINGSDVNHDRLSVNGIRLIINPVRTRDKYNVYTCVAHEAGPEVSKLSSEKSGEFKLTPRYGPQFVRIDGAEGRSPIIRGDVYGPVICRTDCIPDCRLEWERQRQLLISSRTTSNNELEIVDVALPRQREITYTCRVLEVPSSGLATQTLERNLTVQVYFRPVISELRYQDDNDYLYLRAGSNKVKLTEGSDLKLRVNVDSNPPADVTLLRHQVPIANGVLETAGYYTITLNNLRCYHSGMYEVIAENFVTRKRSYAIPSRKQFELHVSCVRDNPMDFHVSRVSYTYVSVEWRPGYNGGTPQYYHIDYMAVGNDWVPASLNISDAGQGQPMTYIVLDLNPATDYVIRLNASNKIGSGLSIKIKVQTLAIPQSNLTTISAVIGGVVSLVVIGIIVVVVVIIKRTTRHHEVQEHLYHTANPEYRDEGYPGGDNDGQGHIYDTTSSDPQGSGYENMVAQGGAHQNNQEDNTYTSLKQSTGQEHVYDSAIPGPQESEYEDVTAKGQEHVYESTRTGQQGSGTTSGRKGKKAKGKK